VAVGAFLILFAVISKVLFPFVTDEIMLIRAFAGGGVCSYSTVILCIGPLCRLGQTISAAALQPPSCRA
jgi:hypothetical protein